MEIRHDLELGCEEGHSRERGAVRIGILGDEGAILDEQCSRWLPSAYPEVSRIGIQVVAKSISLSWYLGTNFTVVVEILKVFKGHTQVS